MNRKFLKWSLITAVSIILIAGGIVIYIFNSPHRNVQAVSADFTMNASQIVNEYLKDSQKANDKYLQENGESKIIAVTGFIASISTDMNEQQVILLKNTGDKAGVSCTFTVINNNEANKLNIGEKVKIKGVIRSGAGYDEDLELYEDVIMEKCGVIQEN